MSVQVENSRGEYVTAIPLPLYVQRGLRGRLHAKCVCQQTFKSEVAYRGHYALVHILGLD